MVVTPTLKAAQVAEQQVGADAFSAAWLIHQHGYRWDRTATGPATAGQPVAAARLLPGDVLLVDEAGMLDQDTARRCSPSPTRPAPGSRSSATATSCPRSAAGECSTSPPAGPARGAPGARDRAPVHRPRYAELSLLMRTGERR